MAGDARRTKAQLIEEIEKLRGRLAALEGAAAGRAAAGDELRTARVPEGFRPPFLRAQDYVRRYFGARSGDPEHGTVEFSGERYILVRAASMSVEFYELIASLYAERGEDEARKVANGFLFDIAHALGKADAKAFHAKMGVSDPLEKLSAGPIHFAHSGWAFVDILPESRPSADEDYYLIYDHPFSFEADSWLRRGKRTDFPVCAMNAGYSSGWCEESFGVPLVAVEIECRARGDGHCRFIMAPPSRIEEHLERCRAGAADLSARTGSVTVPEFFERKRLEEALKDSEERCRSLVENAPNIVIVVDREGVIQFINRTVPGLSAEEVIGKSHLDYVEPEFRGVVTETVERVFRTGETGSYQIRGVGPEGNISWYETHLSPVKRAGQVVAATLFVADITERKAAGEVARTQNRYNRLRAEIWKLAADESLSEEELIRKLLAAVGPELDVSRACYNRVVDDEAECVIEWCASGVKPSIGVKAPKFMARFLARGQNEVITPETALENIPSVLRPAAKPVIDLMAASLDLRSVLAVPCHMGGAMEGLVTLDVCGEREDRPAWTDEQKSVVADVVQIISQSITQRRMAAAVRRAKEDLERRVAERTADLAARHAELVRANQELERLHRAKDEFVAMISHELRTPLVTGLGYIELLLEGHLGPASAEATAGMGVALRNLRRLSGMIDDILSYHSLVRRDKKSDPLPVSFDPAEMLRECREEFLVRSGRDGSGVAVDADEDLPAVRADEDMIRRVIANLLDNADRHAGPGARVRLAARAEGDRVLVSVSDDGPGMSEAAQAQVFEPFVKLSGRREGAGLGLAIVRSALEAHGSEPTLTSAPGRGTEVAFRLPTAPRRGEPEGRESDSERLRRIGAEGARVLVVDDDEDTLDLVKLALGGRGYRVRTAPSAESALGLLGEEPADLAIVDLSLPGMDGAELCARLKEDPATARVPVYMFSARTEDSARERARAAGCDGYIVKPIVVEDFLATVGGALNAAD